MSSHTALSTSWSATTDSIGSWATLGPKLEVLSMQLMHRGLLRSATRVTRWLTPRAGSTLHQQMPLLLLLLHQLPTAAMTLTRCLHVVTAVGKQPLKLRFFCAESARNSITATRNAKSHTGLHTKGFAWHRTHLDMMHWHTIKLRKLPQSRGYIAETHSERQIRELFPSNLHGTFDVIAIQRIVYAAGLISL